MIHSNGSGVLYTAGAETCKYNPYLSPDRRSAGARAQRGAVATLLARFAGSMPNREASLGRAGRRAWHVA
jgi:hypothetical protein